MAQYTLYLSIFIVYIHTMSYFDSSKNWIILLPSGIKHGDFLASELARTLGVLRAHQDELPEPFPIVDAKTDTGQDDNPLILLNLGSHPSNDPGFAWRAADERIEIYGDSAQGLIRGMYDFLAALGFTWQKSEKKPDFQASSLYKLARTKSHEKGKKDPSEFRRLFLDTQELTPRGEDWVILALRNRIDAIVLSEPITPSALLQERILHRKARLIEAAKNFSLSLEDGSCHLSQLLPRRLFWQNKELFRMYQGRRRPDFNFCATNPETISLLKKQARAYFKERSWARVFHIWPDEHEGGAWCSCPSCRAFSPEEQELIAANTLADALVEIGSNAQISYSMGENDMLGIKPRPSLLLISREAWNAQTENHNAHSI
ncbi:hypothetical protein MASR2M78_30530 [Treponema sp.]